MVYSFLRWPTALDISISQEIQSSTISKEDHVLRLLKQPETYSCRFCTAWDYFKCKLPVLHFVVFLINCTQQSAGKPPNWLQQGVIFRWDNAPPSEGSSSHTENRLDRLGGTYTSSMQSRSGTKWFPPVWTSERISWWNQVWEHWWCSEAACPEIST